MMASGNNAHATGAAGGAGLEPAARERPIAELIAGLAAAPAGARVSPADVRVNDVTLDSRAVRPGALFLACRGATHHGLDFAEQAIAAGARAILFESQKGEAGQRGSVTGGRPEVLPSSVREAAEAGRIFLAAVPRLAAEAGAIADRFFDAPSLRLAVAGFTGTNGKTTCAYLTAQALSKLGRRAGYLGTLGCGFPGSVAALDLTTPDAVTVHRQLAALRALGAECVAMEVSSHALEQGRVNGVRFRVAAFTNLTRDHLDFHGSMEAYGTAKARLFERELAARVINVDDPFGRELARRFAAACGGGHDPKPLGAGETGRLIITGRLAGGCGGQKRSELIAGADSALRGVPYVRARDVHLEPAGVRFAVESSWGGAHLSVPLLGDFNVDNVLTVLGVLLTLDVPLDRAAAVLAECTAPPGRMQIVRGDREGPLAIVDYAHTPDALAKALRAARAHCAGKLRVVFGCGGDRDRGKRAPMGRTAHELADEVVVTDDNPRTENPGQIVADILAGIEADARGRTPATVSVEHDRAAAIRAALARSAAGDVVLIAGKGHEDYQIVGRERRPFSDQAIARAFFAARNGEQACGAR